MKRIQHTLELFDGRHGGKKMNCAEAISRAYHREVSSLSDKELKNLKRCGYGRAPGKVCGAFYAGEYLLKEGAPERVDEFRESFEDEAGSLICREIKKKRRLGCRDCVELSARLLSRISQFRSAGAEARHEKPCP